MAIISYATRFCGTGWETWQRALSVVVVAIGEVSSSRARIFYEIFTGNAGRQGRLNPGHIELRSLELKEGFKLNMHMHGNSAITQLQHRLGEGVAAAPLALLSWHRKIL